MSELGDGSFQPQRRQGDRDVTGWGQCHNTNCGKWYRAGTGFEAFPTWSTRTYQVCSQPCAVAVRDRKV